jgi:hypothetical protein
MLHMFHIYVAIYLDVTCVCNGFQTFYMCFSSVLEACFKCFIYLQTYVASVVSGCFKSRSVWRSDPCMGARNVGVGGGVLARARTYSVDAWEIECSARVCSEVQVLALLYHRASLPHQTHPNNLTRLYIC